jgi:hypothetical protein
MPGRTVRRLLKKWSKHLSVKRERRHSVTLYPLRGIFTRKTFLTCQNPSLFYIVTFCSQIFFVENTKKGGAHTPFFVFSSWASGGRIRL